LTSSSELDETKKKFRVIANLVYIDQITKAAQPPAPFCV